MSSKKVLGRGLRALIPVADTALIASATPPFAVPPSSAPLSASRFAGGGATVETVAPLPSAAAAGPPAELPVAKLHANPDQPRRYFDEISLARLVESIRQHGVLQPILVRRTGENYEVVAGERRFLAAQRAGLTQIPVQVRDIGDDVLLETALVENIQRQDLTPLEESEAYRRLIDEMGLTQEQVAQKVGRDRSSVANSLRLLNLPASVKTMLDHGKITAGHARALLTLRHSDDMTLLAHEVADKGLSVRQTELKARELSGAATPGRSAHTRTKRATEAKPAPGTSMIAASNDATLPAAVRALRDMLTTRLATRVVVQRTPAGGHGVLQIEFYSDDDLDRVSSIILGE